MSTKNLNKRVSDLEQQSGIGDQPRKVFLISEFDFKERLPEIDQAKAEGHRTMVINLVAPGDEEQESEWGEYLRSKNDE